MSGSLVARTARELVQPSIVGSVTSVDRVLRTIEDTAKTCGKRSPRLVAVSKKQPLEKVQWAYHQGLQHFGENYLQELHTKATQLQACGNQYDAIKWHYIGRVQRKKTKLLMETPGLWMVETVHKEETANALNRSWGLRQSNSSPGLLKVLVQVNTSGEHTKHGCVPEAAVDLARYVLKDCPHLEFCGLMTIGRIGHDSTHQGPNPDFASLVSVKDSILSSIELLRTLDLSMGMSEDFEHAIEMGSTSVRVGTALFGPREK